MTISEKMTQTIPMKLAPPTPPQLHEATGKSKKISNFEEVASSIYDTDSNMCTFRARKERLLLWIQALGVYHYEFLGSSPEYEISWQDESETIDNVRSIAVEVNKATTSLTANDRQFKITAFLRTGTIQAQGCGFRIFENTYFPILNGIVSKISVSDRSNTIPIVESDKNNNIGITET